MKKLFEKIKNWYKQLPDKKKYVEFITALLSVPVMITVIILNLNNLNQNKKQTNTTDKTTPVQVVITGGNNTNQNRPPPFGNPTSTISATISPTPTSNSCQKTIGPVEILSPHENEVITEDTVCINISTGSGYCPVLWSYQINDGSWSTYTNKDICLYNLTTGNKKLLIKIKSTVTDEVVTLLRNFVYQNPSNTPTASPSASL